LSRFGSSGDKQCGSAVGAARPFARQVWRPAFLIPFLSRGLRLHPASSSRASRTSAREMRASSRGSSDGQRQLGAAAPKGPEVDRDEDALPCARTAISMRYAAAYLASHGKASFRNFRGASLRWTASFKTSCRSRSGAPNAAGDPLGIRAHRKSPNTRTALPQTAPAAVVFAPLWTSVKREGHVRPALRGRRSSSPDRDGFPSVERLVVY
jgi:hypothetical protein